MQGGGDTRVQGVCNQLPLHHVDQPLHRTRHRPLHPAGVALFAAAPVKLCALPRCRPHRVPESRNLCSPSILVVLFFRPFILVVLLIPSIYSLIIPSIYSSILMVLIIQSIYSRSTNYSVHLYIAVLAAAPRELCALPRCRPHRVRET